MRAEAAPERAVMVTLGKREGTRVVGTNLRYMVVARNHFGRILHHNGNRGDWLVDAQKFGMRELPSHGCIMSEKHHTICLRGSQTQRYASQANVIREFIDWQERNKRSIVSLDEEFESWAEHRLCRHGDWVLRGRPSHGAWWSVGRHMKTWHVVGIAANA
jgi:hypothetical protein